MTETEINTTEPGTSDPAEHGEDWDEEEDYDGDEDIDAEAEEIARRLGAELWADITKVNADRAAAANATVVIQQTAAIDISLPSPTRKEEDIITTVKAILFNLESDPVARDTLSSTTISDSGSENVLDVLQRTAASGVVPRAVTRQLSAVILTLARSEVLFGGLRHSNASAIHLDRGKRKREETEGQDIRAHKRPYAPGGDLQTQVTDAVNIITTTLGGTTSQSLDSSLVASIRLQLHQVFLFAVTLSAGGGREMNALQEISGLIQVIGVLSGIQIGQTPDSHTDPFPPNPAHPWLPGQPPDIGTAVYPCLVVGCRKIFTRLYSLRAHQRVHATHRPFRCTICPASFARNHDLKRHIKLHEKKAWKCGGCNKSFSRRDAIKRHKNGSKTRGPKSEACVDAEIIEVELEEEEGEETVREERRAKLWNGIAVHQTPEASGLPTARHYRDDSTAEEGEILPHVVLGIQTAVMSLHGLLQAHVGSALGTPVSSLSEPTDPTGGQATLASVIARAQLQNIPQECTPNALNLDPTLATVSPSPTPASDGPTGPIVPNTVADGPPSLTLYGLSDEQTRLLEQAIASAASAAQAQAEAEAALEEEDDDDVYDQENDDYDGNEDVPSNAEPGPPISQI
ncbi:hypothetical protein BD779DRAFT_1506650 [Infundibulicybe gibba]|nr:hypothetical protein BD779DRAFT_1506650 [Infundibulicybe gibba]